jgi:hypothetical protein
VTALAVLLFAVAVAAGLYQGRIETTWLTRVITAVALMGVSNLLASWPYFGGELSSWVKTYVSGLFHTSLISFTIHVAPFFLAWHVAKWVRGI